MERLNNLGKLKDRRKELRQNETPQEKILWWHFKAKRLGYKFKRQHSFGGYILDFYCAEKKLIVEIDGNVHNSSEAREYDNVRDKYFTDIDFVVLRFSNSEVDADIYKVLTKIKTTLSKL